MSNGGPFVAPAVPISDPFYTAPGDFELLIYVFWFGGLAFFQLVGGAYMSSDNRNSLFWRLWLMATLFMGLVSVALYFYPEIDEAIFNLAGGAAFYRGLTLYHPARFGVIHGASVLLGAFVVLAAMVTPELTRRFYAVVFDFVDGIGPAEQEDPEPETV